MVPTFTTRSISQGGAQLYPGSLAAPTPQSFGAASATAKKRRHWIRPSAKQGPRTAHRPRSARLELAPRLRGVSHWFTLVAPSDLASRTQAVW